MLEQGKMTQEWTKYLKQADPAIQLELNFSSPCYGCLVLFCFIAMFTNLESLNELLY